MKEREIFLTLFSLYGIGFVVVSIMGSVLAWEGRGTWEKQMRFQVLTVLVAITWPIVATWKGLVGLVKLSKLMSQYIAWEIRESGWGQKKIEERDEVNGGPYRVGRCERCGK